MVFFVAASSHFIFFQNPDYKFPKAYFPAFLFKEADHFSADSLAHIGGIHVDKMKFKGSFFILILARAHAHHTLDDAGVRIFVNIHVKAFFTDPAGVNRDAAFNGQVFQGFLGKNILICVTAADRINLSRSGCIINGGFTNHFPFTSLCSFVMISYSGRI